MEKAFEVFRVALRPEPVADLVPGPCKRADLELEFRTGEVEVGLESAVFQDSFHEGVALHEERIVLFEVEFSPEDAGGNQKG